MVKNKFFCQGPFNTPVQIKYGMCRGQFKFEFELSSAKLEKKRKWLEVLEKVENPPRLEICLEI